jgi:hypothetical protein
MRGNTLIVIIGEILLGAMALASLAFGRMDVVYLAAGAFVGLVSGHLNGTSAHNNTVNSELKK